MLNMPHKSWRIKAFEGLEKRRGPGCACCGFGDWYQIDNELIVEDEKRHMFFAIDHVHSTGSIDRKTLGLKGERFFKSIVQKDYPSTVQILCHSCNQAKRLNGGTCPHADDLS